MFINTLLCLERLYGDVDLGLKYHPNDWSSGGIEPATPGLLAKSPVSTCQDRDTSGCRFFQQATPDLCSDPSFAHGSCKRFCGNCPRECYDCPNAVFDPDDCNTTSVCGENKTCVTKHLIATDGHHEYLMTCESKTICVGLKFGFGKRDVEEFGDFARELGDMAKRSIAVDCCDTDFCNYPLQITTTALPTTTTLTPGPYVKDLVFVLDDSGSVDRTNFKHALEFFSQIVNHLDVGPAGVRVSMMASKTHPQNEWYLNTYMYSTKSQVLQAVQNVKYVGGSANTAEALHAVREHILDLNNGDRPGVENTVIVMTNGQSANRTLTAQEAILLKAVSKDVISIGVGGDTRLHELQAIATDPQHVISIQGYEHLGPLVPKMLRLICS